MQSYWGSIFDDLFKNHYWRDFKMVVFSAAWKGTHACSINGTHLFWWFLWKLSKYTHHQLLCLYSISRYCLFTDYKIYLLLVECSTITDWCDDKTLRGWGEQVLEFSHVIFSFWLQTFVCLCHLQLIQREHINVFL